MTTDPATPATAAPTSAPTAATPVRAVEADRAGELERFVDLLRAGDALVLTGAGVSTDSGIPDYRGPDGRERHASPMTIDRFLSSPAERQRYWARSHIGWERFASARPNLAHRSVTRLQAAGLLAGVVTQNVDGLHQAAGTRDVIDVHGRLDAVVCLGCGERRPRVELALRFDACNPGFRARMTADVAVVRPDGDVLLTDEDVAAFRVVDCRRCGGILKPDVVMFGELLPRDRYASALGLVARARSLVVLGSSLTVGSGFRFVIDAARHGIPVAVVTRGRTRGDELATLKLDASLADVLPVALEALGHGG
jgi:NAD-dependent SIR2 family protein deacetylase